MADIIDNLKRQFRRSPLLMQLIYINVAVFLLVHIISIGLMLFNANTVSWLQYIELPSDLHLLLPRLWTIITYMFVHYDVWHILFNMLWLYWFGAIFLLYFSPKHLGGLYFLGGIAGAVFYLAAYNIFPYFADKQGMMCGASAAIMAIVFATTIRVPDYKVNLFLIGQVSLKYIAGATVIIDLLSMSTPNAGGHIAHIGGAVMGIVFALCWNRGKDLTAPINRMIDFVVTRLSRPHIKLRRSKATASTTSANPSAHRRPETDSEYHARKKREMDELDAILDKIKKSGYSALSSEEKKRLFEAGKRN